MSDVGSITTDAAPGFAGLKVDKVQSSDQLPPSADVVVIGGGIAGVTTALSLAERGISVVLCEKGMVAGEQSSRNWGWVRNMGRDPRELPLMIESMRLWDKLHQRLGGQLGFRRAGIAYLCSDERELAKRAAWLPHAAPYQLDTRVIAADELASLVPGSAKKWIGALYTHSDARAEPSRAVPAFAKHAQELGATILTKCAVRGIETTAGRISAAITERGSVRCSAVVLAGGAWSRLFCRNLGLTLPQLKVLASVMQVENVANGPETAALGSGFAFRKREDGGYTVANGSTHMADIVPDSFRFLSQFLPLLRIEWRGVKLRVGRHFVEEALLPNQWQLDKTSPFERVRILDPEPAHPLLAAALSNLQSAFPAFKDAVIGHTWAGLIDATPDVIPVISPVNSLPGFYIATGFSGHGFGIGPGAGRLMADLVTGAPPLVDPTPFRFGRFFDGSRSMPMTGV